MFKKIALVATFMALSFIAAPLASSATDSAPAPKPAQSKVECSGFCCFCACC